jgi:hypothetical protein
LQGLKGSDKTFYDLVSSAWPCRFFPVLLVQEVGWEDPRESPWYGTSFYEYIEDFDGYFSQNVYAITREDFLFLEVRDTSGRKLFCRFRRSWYNLFWKFLAKHRNLPRKSARPRMASN